VRHIEARAGSGTGQITATTTPTAIANGLVAPLIKVVTQKWMQKGVHRNVYYEDSRDHGADPISDPIAANTPNQAWGSEFKQKTHQVSPGACRSSRTKKGAAPVTAPKILLEFSEFHRISAGGVSARKATKRSPLATATYSATTISDGTTPGDARRLPSRFLMAQAGPGDFRPSRSSPLRPTKKATEVFSLGGLGLFTLFL